MEERERDSDAPPEDDRPGGGGATVTRRQFAAGAGAALLLPVAARLSPWATGDAAAGRVAGVASGPGPDAGGPATRPQEAQEEEDPPGTDALVDYVEARWGDRLSEDDREQVRSSVAGNLRAASALDEVELGNGDGPALRFHPYRGPDAP